MNDKNKTIFCFWEPKEKIPAYLKLCMKTWQKYLPDYEIKLLDYEDTKKLLGKNYYSKNLYKYFSYAKQADCIRCALLKKYGGVWFDLDTVVVNSNIYDILNTDSDFITVDKHIGFISARKNSYILKKWKNGIKKRLFLFDVFKIYEKLIKTIEAVVFYLFNDKYKIFQEFIINYKKSLKDACYMGNSIINKYLFTIKDKKKYNYFDRIYYQALREYIWADENNIDYKEHTKKVEIYKEFYFNTNLKPDIKKIRGGVLYLHNSWTPFKYKQMSEEEFLNSNTTLSNILKTALELS